MAKFGAGDPRCIVSDRPDGRNVNEWHWEEKDITEQAQEKLVDTLENTSISLNSTITTISSISGEATLIKKKGKILVIYELDAKFDWSGTIDGKSVSGTIRLPDISQDQPINETQVEITIQNSPFNPKRTKEIKTIFTTQIHKKLETFKDVLLTESKATTKKLVVQSNFSSISSPPTPRPGLGLTGSLIYVGVLTGLGIIAYFAFSKYQSK